MKCLDVVCIGVVLLDLPLGPVDEQIFHNESTMVDQIRLTTGGDAFNEAIILSRLGKRTALIGHIGKDMLGDMIERCCQNEGIVHDGMLKDPDAETRINVVLIDREGQRSFVKTNSSVSRSFLPEEIDYELIKNAKAVSLASIFCSKLRNTDTLMQILKTARKNQVVTFADMVPMTGGETIKDIEVLFPYLDYFLPNQEEAAMLTGCQDPDAMADFLLKKGVKNVIIKLGRDGCLIKNAKERYLVPAYQAKAIDTTGAGDNFVAGFISAILDGNNLFDSGDFANAVAAVSTEAVGATEAVENKLQILAYRGEKRES